LSKATCSVVVAFVVVSDSDGFAYAHERRPARKKPHGDLRNYATQARKPTKKDTRLPVSSAISLPTHPHPPTHPPSPRAGLDSLTGSGCVESDSCGAAGEVSCPAVPVSWTPLAETRPRARGTRCRGRIGRILWPRWQATRPQFDTYIPQRCRHTCKPRSGRWSWSCTPRRSSKRRSWSWRRSWNCAHSLTGCGWVRGRSN
jgi:hypothetical protein